MTETSAAKAAATWSGIAEPGDTWAGALREQLGAEAALDWIGRPYEPLLEEIKTPAGDKDPSAWKKRHQRWHQRLTELNIDAELAELETLGGHLVVPSDPDWPIRLNDLGYAAPAALWVMGEGTLPSADEQAVSIVGSRAATTYGITVSETLARELTANGIAVISGGACGIDAAAHRGALEAQTTNTKQALPGTVAILSGGLSNLHPAGNQPLFERIAGEGGLILAEVPPSFRPARWRFLERNRLIAALSGATVVVEGGMRSGAIATANRAVDLDRVVVAVPGPITSATSQGANQLLKDGATLIASATDVIEALEVNRTKEE